MKERIQYSAHVAVWREWRATRLARLERAWDAHNNARAALHTVSEAERLAASVQRVYPRFDVNGKAYFPDAPIVPSTRRASTYDVPTFFSLTPKG